MGEFLLGNLAITWLLALITLAPLYGGGALLIREPSRRLQFGWPSVVLMGLAYGIAEEASLHPPSTTQISAMQYAISALIIVVLAGGAVLLGRRSDRGLRSGAEMRRAPPPFAAGAATLVAGSAFMGLARLHDAVSASVSVGGMLSVLLAVAIALVVRSRDNGWSGRHELAAAGGFLFTYAWYGFGQVPSVGEVSPKIDLLGNVLFAAAAVALFRRALSCVGRQPTSG